MVLNAMLRAKGATDIMRMQQCTPPMPAEKKAVKFMLAEGTYSDARKEIFEAYMQQALRGKHHLKPRLRLLGQPA